MGIRCGIGTAGGSSLSLSPGLCGGPVGGGSDARFTARNIATMPHPPRRRSVRSARRRSLEGDRRSRIPADPLSRNAGRADTFPDLDRPAATDSASAPRSNPDCQDGKTWSAPHGSGSATHSQSLLARDRRSDASLYGDRPWGLREDCAPRRTGTLARTRASPIRRAPRSLSSMDAAERVFALPLRRGNRDGCPERR